MERTLSLSEAKMKLNHLIEEVMSKDDEFVITKNGSPVAALVPSSVYEGLKETMEIKKDPEFMKEIKKGLIRLKSRKKRYTFKQVFGESIR